MTNEQEVALRNFEARVRGLMMAYQEVKQQNAELQAQLAETQETVACLKRDYNTLKTARMIEVSSEDVKESRAKLAHLIREVDKCIALLDV